MENLKLPDWFEGQVYDEGCMIKNPFSGQEYYLNNIELSMYDFIVGCHLLYEIAGSITDELILDMRKGLSWFQEINPEAYYILLD